MISHGRSGERSPVPFVLRLPERHLLKIARIPRHALPSFSLRVISDPKGKRRRLGKELGWDHERTWRTNGVHTPADISRVTHAMSWRQDHHAAVRLGRVLCGDPQKCSIPGHTCSRGHFHDVNSWSRSESIILGSFLRWSHREISLQEWAKKN